MKKTRLLEIIHEEISSAINEVPYPDGVLDIKKASDISVKPENRDKKPLQDTIKKATDILKSEYPDMSSKSIAQLITKVNTPSSRKPDKDLTIKADDGEKFTITADSQVGKDFKNALDSIEDAIKNQEDIFDTPTKIDDLINKKDISPATIERLEKLKEKGYSVILQFPQTLKAVERALSGDTTKKESEPIEKTPPKPEPKAKSEPKSEPKEEDEDNKELSDKEKAEKSVKKEKKVEKAAREQDEITAKYMEEVEPELKDKIKKSKEGDKEAMAWLKSKQDIIKKYKEAQKVEV